uniref:Polypeptide N-acetylgalactosaminyltransferase 15 n=1 Tax=Chelonoidis abingdonii TaxID=106734 RepID=A0A8C0J312_CHEAB
MLSHIRLRSCRKFHWFISNVYPELHPPEYKPRFSGKLYNTGVGFCADYRSAWDAAEGLIELFPCSDNINQHFEYNSMKEIRFGSALQFCFDVRHEKVILQNCTQETENNQQQWDVQEGGMIVHILSGKCLEAVKSEAEKDLSLHVCNKNENQLCKRRICFLIQLKIAWSLLFVACNNCKCMPGKKLYPYFKIWIYVMSTL